MFSSTTTVHSNGTHTTTSNYINNTSHSAQNFNPLDTQLNPLLDNPNELDVGTDSESDTEPESLISRDDEILDLGLPTCVCRHFGAWFWIYEALKRTRKSTNPDYSLCCQLGHVELGLLA